MTETVTKYIEDLQLLQDAEKASNEIKAGLYGRLVTLVMTMGVPPEDALDTIEKDIALNIQGPIPAVFRSAKSVISKALTLGVGLLDEDGNPRGKTAVEKSCKEMALKPKGIVIPDEQHDDKAAFLRDLLELQHRAKLLEVPSEGLVGLDTAIYFTEKWINK